MGERTLLVRICRSPQYMIYTITVTERNKVIYSENFQELKQIIPKIIRILHEK